MSTLTNVYELYTISAIATLVTYIMPHINYEGLFSYLSQYVLHNLTCKYI